MQDGLAVGVGYYDSGRMDDLPPGLPLEQRRRQRARLRALNGRLAASARSELAQAGSSSGTEVQRGAGSVAVAAGPGGRQGCRSLALG